MRHFHPWSGREDSVLTFSCAEIEGALDEDVNKLYELGEELGRYAAVAKGW